MTDSTVAPPLSSDTRGEPSWILGIDGGGTKTLAWLARSSAPGEFEVIGKGIAGSSNLRAVGLDAALKSLDQAIQAAQADAQLQDLALAGAALALAGAGQPAAKKQIFAWAEKRQLASKLSIVHDADAVLAAGTPAGVGIALIVGTGSACMGRDSQNNEAVSGGWGYWFGDEGSAFWIGRTALLAVSQFADRRGPSTRLLQAVLDHLNITEPREILSALASSGDVRLAIAGLCELVIATAEEGDEVASQIVRRAAKELAEMVESTAARLAQSEPFPLALAGGVVCGSKLLRGQLQQELEKRKLQPDPIQLVPHPVEGCVRIACRELAPHSGL